MKRPQLIQDDSMELKMTPMIDVVFLLLVFFVWTASFQVIEQVLLSEMLSQIGAEPSEMQNPPPEKDFPDVVLKIGWDGQQPNWQINGQPMASLEEVRDHLIALADIKLDAPVILDPDKQTPLGHVIETYDVSKLAGFQEISFTVDPANL